MASRLPIRWRLTLWQVALLGAALGLFALVLHLGLRHYLYEGLDDTLRAQGSLALGALARPGDAPSLAAVRASDDYLLRVVDADGRVLGEDTAPAPELRDVPIDGEALAAAAAGQPDLRWEATGHARVRVLTLPIVVDGRPSGALQLGVSEEDVVDLLRLSLMLTLVGGPLVLLVASAGGLWLAGRALAPVDRIARLAAEIEESDLSGRIEQPLADDEVGRLARTFNAMLDRLEAAFRRQRQFSATAAHELRTPLALLQSQLEVARARPRAPEEDQAALDALASDVDRLIRISGALLALARSDARQARPTLDAVDLPTLLELVAEQFAPLAEELGVALALDGRPVTLQADQDQLVQLLVNLVDNALRHTPAGRQITLGCRLDGPWARLWVADEGVGIPPEHLPRVFERFYRVERDHARGGIGLGLSICQAIVEAHGGRIELSSQPGEGTTVVVMLPYPGPGAPRAGGRSGRAAHPGEAHAPG